jgi:2-polyprenyl-3-methyl-5-hydroxy-6-metoxy-1,4-benzoquinol methylase
VGRQIAKNNPWYTESQFVWAEKESTKRIYEHRFLFFNKILQKEALKKGKITLLDLGCGDGYWSKVFAQFPFCELVGVDYNALRLERARKMAPEAKFLEFDATEPNEQLGKFDVLFCSQLIEHIKDDVSFLSIIREYLKEDGVLIFGTTNEGCFLQRLRYLRTREKGDHVHFYREKEIRSKIERAGFIIDDIYREVFYPGFDRIYYKLTSTDIGFKILELLTTMFPSQCSDYYFKCRLKQARLNL